MSLDNVDDKATQLLMVEFYNNLAKGCTLNESLKRSQRFLRNYGNGEYSKPEFWGSFILLDAVE